jgi:hypothetical protein
MTAPTPQQFIQGQGTVSADNLNTFVQTVSNITQLRSLIGLPGMQILLEGLVVPGDGGAGPFYWNVTSIGPDNGTSVIVPQQGVPGAWLRLAISQTSLVSVANIAALQALNGGSATPSVYVEGYYTINDGGEGVFIYQPSDVVSPSNGGTIIIDASGHRYYRETNGSAYLVEWFGAKGDGITDDTTVFNNTLNAAVLVGSYAQANQSKAGYVIAGQVVIPSNTALIGELYIPVQNTQYGAYTPKGPWLLFTGTSINPIQPNSGTLFSGFVLYWPNQTDTNPPIVYPFAIVILSSTDIEISNLYVMNAYGIVETTANHARLHVRNIQGWVLNTGFYIDGSVDVDRLEDIHIFPAWPTGGGTGSLAYNRANAYYFQFGRNDGIQVSNIFTYGGLVGMNFFLGSLPSAPGATYGTFVNIEIDSIPDPSGNCITFSDYSPNGIQFTNVLLNSAAQGILIDVNVPTGVINFTNLSIWDSQTGIKNVGNTRAVFDGVTVSSSMPGACLFCGPVNSGYTSNTIITNGAFANYNGGSGPTDVNIAPVAGAVANLWLDNVKYISGGNLPSVASAGTFHIYQNNKSPIGFSATTVTPPGSGGTVTNINFVPVAIAVTGGTVTAVYINGVYIGAPYYFIIGPYETVAVAYTGTLTWEWYGF